MANQFEQIGERIKAHIERSGLKQTYVAQRAGIEISRFNAILNGNREIRIDEYGKICKILGVPFGSFLSDGAEKQKDQAAEAAW